MCLFSTTWNKRFKLEMRMLLSSPTHVQWLNYYRSFLDISQPINQQWSCTVSAPCNCQLAYSVPLHVNMQVLIQKALTCRVSGHKVGLSRAQGRWQIVNVHAPKSFMELGGEDCVFVCQKRKQWILFRPYGKNRTSEQQHWMEW